MSARVSANVNFQLVVASRGISQVTFVKARRLPVGFDMFVHKSCAPCCTANLSMLMSFSVAAKLRNYVALPVSTLPSFLESVSFVFHSRTADRFRLHAQSESLHFLVILSFHEPVDPDQVNCTSTTKQPTRGPCTTSDRASAPKNKPKD